MKCEKIGSILRAGSGRVISLETDATCKILGCYGMGNFVELFYLLSKETIKTRYAKRMKKERRKAQK